jgi:hypothetical protein
METIVIALVVSIVSPAILALINNYFRRQDKKLDWEREDNVAEKAREAAKLLLAANERVAKTAEVTNSKLDVIHGLVNSQMTAAMESELNATVAQIVLMQEVSDLKTSKGVKPQPKAVSAMNALNTKISELRAALGDRKAEAERIAAKGV